MIILNDFLKSENNSSNFPWCFKGFQHHPFPLKGSLFYKSRLNIIKMAHLAGPPLHHPPFM